MNKTEYSVINYASDCDLYSNRKFRGMGAKSTDLKKLAKLGEFVRFFASDTIVMEKHQGGDTYGK